MFRSGGTYDFHDVGYCGPHLRVDREAGIESGTRLGEESLREFELEG